jgi:transaldolase
MATSTLLDQLRSKTLVDCDTLDDAVAKRLGPFQDCTSNQAIAYGELERDVHVDLLKASAAKAKEVAPKYPDITTVSLAVELSVSTRTTVEEAEHRLTPRYRWSRLPCE